MWMIEFMHTTKPENKANSQTNTNTTQDSGLRSTEITTCPLHIPTYFSCVKPARQKSSSSTKCHFWHIMIGSKCLDSCFRNKLLTAGDDETKQIQNYSCTARNLLNLLQPGASPSLPPWEKAGKDQRKYWKRLLLYDSMLLRIANFQGKCNTPLPIKGNINSEYWQKWSENQKHIQSCPSTSIAT